MKIFKHITQYLTNMKSKKIEYFTFLAAMIVIIIFVSDIRSDAKIQSGNIKRISEDINEIKTSISILPDIKWQNKLLWTSWSRNLYKQNSPTTLTEYGKEQLKKSNINKFIEPYLGGIIDTLKIQDIKNVDNGIVNIIREFQSLYEVSEFKDEIELAESNADLDITSLLFLAAIYYEKYILIELGFSEEDIKKNS